MFASLDCLGVFDRRRGLGRQRRGAAGGRCRNAFAGPRPPPSSPMAAKILGPRSPPPKCASAQA